MSSSDFALIGHLESWETAATVVRAFRGGELPPLSPADVQEILPWIPPRTICRVIARSSLGTEAHGVYIDSFIPPDRLEPRHHHANLQRIHEAAQYAVREGAPIASLGGFTSILLEGKVQLLTQDPGTVFTTGNTLTVAYIVHGIEEVARLSERSLSDLTLLVIGATGDVGSGCARYLAPRVKRLLLCARNPHRLRAEWDSLRRQNPDSRAATDVAELLPAADVILCAASLPSPSLDLSRARPGAIVCDAGYPRNIAAGSAGVTTFSGGMGQVLSGVRLEPDLSHALTRHPFPNVVHGCLLEGIVLAFEGRYEAYSRGRGFITPEKVDEIWELARKHGFALAPLFSGEVAWDIPAGDTRRKVPA